MCRALLNSAGCHSHMGKYIDDNGDTSFKEENGDIVLKIDIDKICDIEFHMIFPSGWEGTLKSSKCALQVLSLKDQLEQALSLWHANQAGKRQADEQVCLCCSNDKLPQESTCRAAAPEGYAILPF